MPETTHRLTPARLLELWRFCIREDDHLRAEIEAETGLKLEDYTCPEPGVVVIRHDDPGPVDVCGYAAMERDRKESADLSVRCV